MKIDPCKSFLPKLAHLGQLLAVFALLLALPAPSHAQIPAAGTMGAFVQTLPSIPKNVSNNNAHIYLYNPSSQTAALVLSFNTGYTWNDSLAPNQAKILKTTDLAGLPNGVSSLTITSDQPVEAMARTIRGSGDILGSYYGQTVASTSLQFAPILYGSALVLANTQASFAEVVINLFSTEGSLYTTFAVSIPPFGTYTYGNSSSSTYSATVSSSQPLVGLVSARFAPRSDHEFYPPLPEASTSAFLPRAFKSQDDGDGAFSTHLFITNPSAAAASVSLTYKNGSGTFVHSGISVAAGGMTTVDLSGEAMLPGGSSSSVTLTSTQPVVLSELSDNDTLPALAGHTAYSGLVTGSTVELPFLVLSATQNSSISLMNTGASSSNAAIAYYDLNGILVTTQAFTLAPGAALRTHLKDIPELGSSFTGRALVSADQPIAALVDTYINYCTAPSNVEIGRDPAGDLYAGDTALFMASASGTNPFNYAWTLDGGPVGANASIYDHTFNTAATYTVGVTVSNACGQATASLPVEVKPVLPDLSGSTFSVNHTTISNNGDVLTYTVLLSNTSSAAASATLTDPLPAQASYVPGSGFATDGGAVTFSGGALHWAGTVSQGADVRVTFQVTVQGLLIGATLSNTVSIDDGAGTVLQRSADSVYNPGWGLSINSGDLATNLASVTLGYNWDASKNISEFRVSNDGGFPADARTSAWMPVDSGDPSYSGWTLASLPNTMIPRTVYIQFRDGSGVPYGPYQDDIIYDATSPAIASVEILSSGSASARYSLSATIRVTAGDDNSGVGEIQVSNQADFNTFTSFQAAGAVTDIPWTLQASGLVYVRVVDRAGNFSPVKQQRGGSHYLFLPSCVR